MLENELSGDLKDLLMMIIEAEEEEYNADSFHTEEKAEEDAMQFDKLGLGQWGTDEKGLFEIIVKSPPEHLERVNSAFVERTGYSLAKSLEKEVSGEMHLPCFCCIVQS